MRIGVVIEVGAGAGAQGDTIGLAADAEDAGLDLVLLQADRGAERASGAALTAAAFLAAGTSAVRLVARAPVGPHPVLIAEQAAVADNASGGRLTLVLGASGAGLLSETAEVVLAATAPRPFAHRGERWTVPGAVQGNAGERRLSVTPQPAQLELPVWLIGDGAAAAGCVLGLSHVSDAGEAPAEAERAWSQTEQRLGRAAGRLRRPAIRDLPLGPGGDFDDTALTAMLIDESERWGLDVVAIRLPSDRGRSERRRAITRLASLVRPPLQIDRVPAHVEEYWRRELAPRLSE
jgi:alkanesulfonate monooxygenase SsuD/methylene tetrahydromethanopterin reductase-like flavin-dependent oxidoreductase (luciferase family)